MRYHARGLISRQTAVLDPQAVAQIQLAIVLVALEPGTAKRHAALRRRLLATPQVQQCYDVAGQWDYVIVLATSGMSECRDLVDRLLLNDPSITRCDTLPVFDPVKLGLAIPTRPATTQES